MPELISVEEIQNIKIKAEHLTIGRNLRSLVLSMLMKLLKIIVNKLSIGNQNYRLHFICVKFELPYFGSIFRIFEMW